MQEGTWEKNYAAKPSYKLPVIWTEIIREYPMNSIPYYNKWKIDFLMFHNSNSSGITSFLLSHVLFICSKPTILQIKENLD